MTEVQSGLQQSKSATIRTLQSARFIFVLLIYLSHCALVEGGTAFDYGGEAGVAFFFVLSGFVLSLGYGEKIDNGSFGTCRFMAKRLAKLYPLHILLLVVAVVFDARLGLRYSVWQILSGIFLVQTWTMSDDYIYVANGVAWFLCDMMFMYIIFKLLYKFVAHASVRTLCAVGVAVLAAYVLFALQVPDDGLNSKLYTNPLLRSIDFALGIALFRFYQSQCSKTFCTRLAESGVCKATVLELVAILLLVASCLAYYSMSKTFRLAMLFWVVMPMVVYVLAATENTRALVARFLHTRTMLWLGGISFEIFLTHRIVMRVTLHFVAPWGNTMLMCVSYALAFVCTVVVSWALSRWFVMPIYNKVSRCLNKQDL